MTERRIDDVTGKVIENGRSYKLLFVGGYRTELDTQDVDALLRVLRDKLTGKSSSPPLEIQIQTVEWMPLPNDYRKYAPAPEPEPLRKVADDAPMGPIRSFPVKPNGIPAGLLGRPPYSFLNLGPTTGAGTGRGVRGTLTDDDRARLDKARRKYASLLAEFCGCKDANAHESNLKE